MKKEITATTTTGTQFWLWVEEKSNQPELEVKIKAVRNGKESTSGYLNDRRVSNYHGYRGIMTTLYFPGEKITSYFLALSKEEQERIDAFLADIQKENEQRRARWVEISLWPCQHSDYRVHSVGGFIDEPVENIIARATDVLASCCLPRENAEEVARKSVEEFFIEKKEKEERKRAAEAYEAEIRELARQTGKEQLLKENYTDCDGSVSDCSCDLVKTYITPDGSIRRERIHLY
ncbi:MAG: hypothetical protein WBI96_03465 [Candidatus Hydrothermia bacterium]